MLIVQALKFGVVGVVAAATQGAALIVLVEAFSFDPVLSTPLAFSLAFLVSYSGHHWWTFHARGRALSRAGRFLAIQLLAMTITTAIMAATVNVLYLDYRIGLIAGVTLVPVMTFLMSRRWAFART